MLFQIATSISLLAGLVSAQTSVAIDPAGAGLKINTPNSGEWWVQGGSNLLAWTCHSVQIPSYTLMVLNPNTKLLTAPEAFLTNLNNADCMHLVDANQFTPGTGYQVALTNLVNETDYYAISEPFEIKPAGSTYASITTTDFGGPTNAPGSAGGPSPTAGSSASQPSTSNPPSSALRTTVPLGLFGAVAAFAFFV